MVIVTGDSRHAVTVWDEVLSRGAMFSHDRTGPRPPLTR
jgi:hypothetical protein